MWKIKRTRKVRNVYDEEKSKNAFKKTIYDLVFAMAIALKVSPTRLVNAIDGDKIRKYAEAFDKKIIKKMEKNLEKTKKDFQKEVDKLNNKK